MFNLFLAAFALGFIFNATPGAVFAETIREGVRGGFKPALAVQLGSLVGDAAWAILGLVGVGLLLQLQGLRLYIGSAGALYLLWLAVDAWRAAGRGLSVEPIDKSPNVHKAARAGVILSLTNPQNLAYWAALGSAMGAVGVSDPAAADFTLFFAGFMASSLVWAFVCAAMVRYLFKYAGAGWTRFTYRACALAFLLLALAALKDLWQQHSHTKSATAGPNDGYSLVAVNDRIPS